MLDDQPYLKFMYDKQSNERRTKDYSKITGLDRNILGYEDSKKAYILLVSSLQTCFLRSPFSKVFWELMLTFKQ